MSAKNNTYLEEGYVKLLRNGYSKCNKMICSHHPVLKSEEVIVRADDECVEITVPTIDYRGEGHKTSKGSGGTNRTYCPGLYIPDGVYKIDEDESNEDRLVFYFEDYVKDYKPKNK